MKFVFRTTLLASLAIAGMMGCATNEIDTDTEGTGNEEEAGVSTLMTLNLEFAGGAATRAVDNNATAEESAVDSVSVFIYNNSGVLQTDTTIVVSAFTGSDNVYTPKAGEALIKTTAGPKSIFVGINLPYTLRRTLHTEASMGGLSAGIRTFTRADIIGMADKSATAGDPNDVVRGGFVMCSPALTSATLVVSEDGTGNNVSVAVSRLAAKVTMEKGSALDLSDVAGGSFKDNLTFAIDRFNEKSFLLQGASPTYVDPNWSTADWGAPSNFLKAGDLDAVSATHTNSTIAALYGYQAVNDNGESISRLNNRYVAENTSQDMRKGTLTRLVVKGEFMPAYVWVTDPSNDKTPPLGYKKVPFDDPEAGGVAGTPRTFYLITTPDGTAYYTLDGEVATGAPEGSTTASDLTGVSGGLAAELGVPVVEKYIDGVCYYDLLLNNKQTATTQYQPLRNDYYKCTVTDIAALGDNTEELDQPTEMASVETKMSVTVDVQAWNVVTDDYVLGAE